MKLNFKASNFYETLKRIIPDKKSSSIQAQEKQTKFWKYYHDPVGNEEVIESTESATGLDIIIEEIYNTYRFGSEIKQSHIDELIVKFNLNDLEEERFLGEILELKLNIINDVLIDKIQNLLEKAGKNGEIQESDFESWCLENDISIIKQERLKVGLTDQGYTVLKKEPMSNHFKIQEQLVIEDSPSSNGNEVDFSFIDDMFDEISNLDIDSEEFNKELSKLKVPVGSDNNFYIETIKSGEFNEKESALQGLVLSNEKLIWKIVMKYRNHQTEAFDLEDMFQAGIFGLMTAIDKFDKEKGYHFTTYATWWIRQSISRNIADHSTIIRIPVHMRDDIGKLIKAENEHWFKHSAAITNKELSKKIGKTEQEILKMKTYIYQANMDNLNRFVGESGDTELLELIPTQNETSTERLVERELLSRDLEEILSSLTQKEKNIIELRFGLKNGREHTLEEVGEIYGVTRERIRQLEAKALRNLRHPKRIKKLEGYIGETREGV